MPPGIPARARSRTNVPRQVLQPHPSNDVDVIVISSDDDEPVQVPRKRPPPVKSTKQGKTKARSPVPAREDSSSEDDKGKKRKSPRNVAEMERIIKKLKEVRKLRCLYWALRTYAHLSFPPHCRKMKDWKSCRRRYIPRNNFGSSYADNVHQALQADAPKNDRVSVPSHDAMLVETTADIGW